MRKLQAGDTIIEVMLAMSVIGIVLGAAFGIANRSVAMGQEAQERSEALKIAETQLEIFRTQYATSASMRDRAESDPFCFDMASSTYAVHADEEDPCTTIGPSGNEGLYSVKIVPPAAAFDPTGSYTIEVRWERLGATSSENAENTLILYYKLNEAVGILAATSPTPPAPAACGVNTVFDTYTYAKRVLSGDYSRIYRMVDVNKTHPTPTVDLLKSTPDYLIPAISFSASCSGYSVTSVSQCRIPSAGATDADWASSSSFGGCGADQQDEAVRVSFFSSYTGTELGKNVSCSGTRIAYFDTTDKSTSGTRWNDIPTMNVMSYGDASCMEIQHVCSNGTPISLSPAYGQPTTCGTQSSVYFVSYRIVGI